MEAGREGGDLRGGEGRERRGEGREGGAQAYYLDPAEALGVPDRRFVMRGASPTGMPRDKPPPPQVSPWHLLNALSVRQTPMI